MRPHDSHKVINILDLLLCIFKNRNISNSKQANDIPDADNGAYP